MYTPLVSIIIPVYNCENYIDETINSALYQEYPNIEIIIVDDGSTDKSLSIAKKYEGQRDLKLIHQQNAGEAVARNTGLYYANGEWIQFLDADDLISKDKISSQIELIRKYGSNSIYICDYYRFWDDPNTKPKLISLRAEENYCNSIEWLTKAWEKKADTIITTWLIHRQHIDKAGKFDKNLIILADADFICKVLLQNLPIKYSRKGFAYYRQEVKNSASKGLTENKLNNHLRAYKQIKEYVLPLMNQPHIRQALAYMFIDRFFKIYFINKANALNYLKEALDLKKYGDIALNRFWGRKLSLLKHVIGRKRTFILECHIRQIHRTK
jgi:glycosyltransferase involved in cell wall biosynthesis